MIKKKLPKSIRKYIRREKARIRREVFDLKEQERLINELYQRLTKKSTALPKKPEHVRSVSFPTRDGADVTIEMKNGN